MLGLFLTQSLEAKYKVDQNTITYKVKSELAQGYTTLFVCILGPKVNLLLDGCKCFLATKLDLLQRVFISRLPIRLATPSTVTLSTLCEDQDSAWRWPDSHRCGMPSSTSDEPEPPWMPAYKSAAAHLPCRSRNRECLSVVCFPLSVVSSCHDSPSCRFPLCRHC